VTAMFQKMSRQARSVGATKKHVYPFVKKNHGQLPTSMPDKHRRELQRVGKATARLHANWNGSDKHYEKLEQLHADAERAYARLARDE
jgi:hypothetical protein